MIQVSTSMRQLLVASVATLAMVAMLVPSVSLADDADAAGDTDDPDGAVATATAPDDAPDELDRSVQGTIPGAVPGEDDDQGDGDGGPATADADRLAPDLPAPAAETDPTGEVTTSDTDTADAEDGFDPRSTVADTGEVSPDLRLHGSGWGHGVGMSQYGAYAQALEGWTAEDILTHYYAGTELTTDARSSTERIRVGIRNDRIGNPVDAGDDGTELEALDGTVDWQVCIPPESQAPDGTIGDDRCEDWFDQAQGDRLRVAPLEADGVATPNGTQTGPATGGSITDASNGNDGDDGDGAIEAPRGGILIERQTSDGSWEPYRAYKTNDSSDARLPVARAIHGDDRIEGQRYSGSQDADRQQHDVYAFGWRDVHVLNGAGGVGADTSPGDHKAYVVQDVDSREQYLRGLAEMPNGWSAAALEAQAITGRTFALGRSSSPNCQCTVIATPADQVYVGESKVESADGQRWADAVAATQDQALLAPDGDLAQIFYSSSHGARSENVEDSWAFGTDPIDYLRSVDDPWSSDDRVNNPYASWTAMADQDAITDLIERGTADVDDIDRVERIDVLSRTEGGTPREIRVTAGTGDDERTTFTTTLGEVYGKQIAGAAMRRELPASGDGATNNRLRSSQLDGFGLAPFTDDDGSTHEYAISWAAEAGVVQGVDAAPDPDDGTFRFRPRADVTRAQMATFLYNTFDIAAPAAGADTFPDVQTDSTHHEAIEAIAAVGVAEGYGDGTYQPDASVDRQEMATFLVRAQALEADDDVAFADVSSDNTHADNIAAIAEAEITAGCDDQGNYCPGDPVTRGQLATFVYRSVQR